MVDFYTSKHFYQIRENILLIDGKIEEKGNISVYHLIKDEPAFIKISQKGNIPKIIKTEDVLFVDNSSEIYHVYFAREKCRDLQREMQSVATQYIYNFFESAFANRKLDPVYEIICA